MSVPARKKIFVMNFSTSILKDVCLELKKRGIDVVYWQGYREHFLDFSKDKQNFPETIFAHSYDIAKNIPPQRLDISGFNPPGKDIIEKLYEYGWQGMAMMERADFHNSRFIRKRNIYYRYVKFFLGLIKKFQPDAILFYMTPHSTDQYVLYALARICGVKTVMLESTDFACRHVIVNDYKKQSTQLLDFYLKNKDKKFRLDDLNPDMKDYYSRQMNPELDATPEVIQKIRKHTGVPLLRLPGPKKIIKHIAKGTFIKTALPFLKMFFGRVKMRTIDEYPLGISYKWYAYKQELKTKFFKKEYMKLQQAPDFSKKFIYLPLHNQPEKTTSPLGGLFDDLILMADIVASSIPDDWVIYVKENTLQWSKSNTQSEIFRFKDFYKQLIGLKNVRFVPAETSAFDLINNSQAVATVTGTAGWEAVLRGKPTLMFGYRWYMYCDGVFRITDVDSCREAIEKIKNGYKPDKQKVLNYLVSLDKNSIIAKDYKAGVFIESGVSHEENVKNISEAFYKEIME